ncbi:hypothetical protein L6164_012843 [Bauhinia variegata]|uniref:Uncharacterized protein n=1 Tax=Bauhinia variegata TaxID=167791 RepID=A0ACB9PCT6_BAUVA|nr:hypothetical protein L6164_012843 [Bauhinia variegata]
MYLTTAHIGKAAANANLLKGYNNTVVMDGISPPRSLPLTVQALNKGAKPSFFSLSLVPTSKRKMAIATKSSMKPVHQTGESEYNPITLSDEQILEQIYTTHVHEHAETKFDVDSLFTLVENILKRSTHIVDSVVQGSQLSLEHFDDKTAPLSFNSPICTLKQISSELSCKPPGEEIAHRTTLTILNKLSSYSWEAKAVLTLAAFAQEYGEFWLLTQLQPTDPLAKSLAVMKRVPVHTKAAALQKHRQAIVELNSLIKSTLQVIEHIFELVRLTSYDAKDVTAIEQIPVDVYWTIITVAAIVTQIDAIITDSEPKQDLYYFGQKINITLSKLRKQIALSRQQIYEAEYYRELRKIFQTPTEIMEVLKYLIFPKDAPQQLYDGATQTMVNIDVIRKKNVFLFISTLDITDEEIAVLRPVYDHIKTNEQYKIVWLPIVEEWNETQIKKFESLKTKMPWYVVQHFGTIAGFKYIKEEWQFKKKPMVVVLNHQGKVLHPNAFHLIQVWGLRAFPFTISVQETIDKETNWVATIVSGIHPSIETWIKEEKYIFFYGGRDKEWIQKFTNDATVLSKEAKVPIELFYVNEDDKNLYSRFWSGIESMFVTKVHKTEDIVTQEVQKILSYKNENAWAVLSKGPTVVVSGRGNSILETVDEFENWRELVPTKGFEFSFKEYHERIVRTTHRCSFVQIPNVAGKLPETLKCSECSRTMESYISYKCCHDDGNGNGAN